MIIHQATDMMTIKLWIGAHMNGLENVKVSVEEHDVIEKTYTIECSNLEN